MLRDLIKEGGLYSLANIFTKGISLLLIPFYTTYFSPADYGVIDFLNLFTLFITAIFSLQLNQGLARYVAEPTLDEGEKITYASTGIWTTIVCLSVVTGILIAIPDQIIELLSSDDVKIEKTTYRLAVATIFFSGLFYLLGVHMRFIRMSRAYALLSFSNAFLTILFILLFVIVYDYGIDSIYMSYLLVVPALILIQLYLLRHQFKFTFSSKALLHLLAFSTPLIPAAIATLLMNFADRIYIKEILQDDFAQLGIYAMAGKFASIVGLIVAGFTMAIAPLIFQRQYEEKTSSELSRIFYLYISVGTIGVLGLSFLSKEMIVLFTHPRFHGAYEVMPIMYLTAYFTGFMMFAQGMNIKKKTILTAVLVITFGSLNVGLNQLLVPEFGIMGAAVATLISAFGYYACSFYFSQKYYPFEYSLIKVIPISMLHIALIVLMMQWDPEISVVNVLLKLLIVGAYVFILYFSKLLDIKQIINFLKRLASKDQQK